MTGSRLYDIISVASAAKAVALKNLGLQKAGASYFLNSQRTLISLANPITQKFNVNISTPSSAYTAQRPVSTNPLINNVASPLEFDRRPNISPKNIDLSNKREYSTDSAKKPRSVIGEAEKKNVSVSGFILFELFIDSF